MLFQKIIDTIRHNQTYSFQGMERKFLSKRRIGKHVILIATVIVFCDILHNGNDNRNVVK